MTKISVIVCALLLSGCSVYMAATKEGVDIAELSACETRACIEASNPEILNTYEPADDGSYEILYRAQRAEGSASRAVMHGLLDVATLGIWEVVGTPMEGYMSSDKFVVFKAKYTADDAVEYINIQGAS